MGKFCMWDCGRNKSVPKFDLFLRKLEAKQETERLIASKNKKLQDLRKRWQLFYFLIEMVTDGNMRSFGPDPKKFAACILLRRYISVISVENLINVCVR